jgi:hypothetical protein
MKKLIQISIITAIFFALSIAAFGQKATRIKFAKGKTSATVSGYLRGYKSKKVFVIRVRKGQTMRINSKQAVTVTVLKSGVDVSDKDLSCNSRAIISPTASGDYRIEVVECIKVDPWRGTFWLRVSVK